MNYMTHQGHLNGYRVIHTVIVIYWAINTTHCTETTVQIGKNFIFQNMGEYLINPKKLKIVKFVNMNATKHIITSLNQVGTAYNKYCNQYGKNATIKYNNNWILVSNSRSTNKEAEYLCKTKYSAKLPEIKDKKDLEKAFKIMDKNHDTIFANIRVDEDNGEFTYTSDNIPINNFRTLTDNNMNITNSSSRDRIVYTLKDNRIIIESRHYLDFRKIHTVCETWKNTNAENIVSSFKDICSRNNHKWQPLIKQAISTLDDIQPTKTKEEERTPRALSDIGVCILAICNYGNADVIIKETIDDINDKFFKISKEINTVYEDITQIKASLDHISNYYELHDFENEVNRKVNLLIFMANKYYQTINQVFNCVDLGIVNHQILNASQLQDIEKKSNKKISHHYQAMEITALRKHNNYVLIIHIPIRTYFNKATLYRVINFPVFVNGVRLRAVQQTNYILINSLKAATPVTATECNEERKVCTINKPLSIIGMEEECMLSQLDQNNHSCPNAIDNNQHDYFHILGNTIYYAVNKSTEMTLICAKNENIMRFTTTFVERGYFKLRRQCIMKNSEILILPGSYTSSETNHTSILKNINTKPIRLEATYKKTMSFTTRLPFNIMPIENKSNKTLLQVLNEGTSSLLVMITLIVVVWATIKYRQRRDRRTELVSYRRATTVNEPQNSRPMTRTTTV